MGDCGGYLGTRYMDDGESVSLGEGAVSLGEGAVSLGEGAVSRLGIWMTVSRLGEDEWMTVSR